MEGMHLGLGICRLGGKPRTHGLEQRLKLRLPLLLRPATIKNCLQDQSTTKSPQRGRH